MATDRPYLPAAGRDAFLRFYDPLTRLLGFTRAIRPLLAQADLRPGQAVLDIGCGTGTLAVLIKKEHPGIEVTGLDPDPLALERATRKAARAGVQVRFDRGFGDALPYPDARFDRVFSSMMFHHLGKNERTKTLAEVHRVLKPGGRLEFVDLAGGSHNFLAQVLHGGQLNAAMAERLIARMREAGFVDARHTRVLRTAIGVLAYFQAERERQA
jgi:ubiquinone/menaquinone biosynthesis C-methylase UbiE